MRLRVISHVYGMLTYRMQAALDLESVVRSEHSGDEERGRG